MNKLSSVFRMALAATTASAVYLASCSIASAQTTATSNQGANNPPVVSAAQPVVLPHSVNEVVKMYQGGIDKDVIINFINSDSIPFRLNADEIIYLRTLGLPQEVTKAMLVRDGQLQQQQPANQPYYQQQPMPGAMQPPPYGAYGDMSGQQPVQVVTPTTPAPAVTDYGDYTDYGYGYPYYPYYYGGPYYGYGYGWPWGGWGWGRGWGYGGYRGGFRGGVGFHGGVGGFHGGVGGFHGGGGFAGGHGGGAFRGGGGGGG
ncbi:MAG TPA: hypothetical protein VGR14_03665, partial [Verrucomicrobiae bacterium]|nr:hypothetical protein [Verrucomicrobiae bacterium]